MFDVVNLILGAVALVIAIISLWRAWPVQRLQTEVTTLQLQRMRGEEAEKGKAHVTAWMEKRDRSHRFCIGNKGPAAALSVRFELDPQEGKNSPLVQNDYAEKIPIKRLAPGNTVSLIAALTMGTATAFEARLTWENEDGTPGSWESTLSV